MGSVDWCGRRNVPDSPPYCIVRDNQSSVDIVMAASGRELSEGMERQGSCSLPYGKDTVRAREVAE